MEYSTVDLVNYKQYFIAYNWTTSERSIRRFSKGGSRFQSKCQKEKYWYWKI